MEKVDILLATYNGEKYLSEQIESILNQSYDNFNLIISDDASTDETIKIIKSYQKKDNRIISFFSKKNKGYLKNFEFLCSKIESRICLFCDQDDVWDKEKIEKLLKCKKNENAVLAFCDMRVTTENLEIIYPSFQDYNKKRKRCIKYKGFDLIKLENVISGCCMLVDTDIVKKSIPFPKEFYVHDWWISLIASQHGKIVFLNETLQCYRQHRKNSIGALKKNKHKTFSKYRKELIDFKKKQFQILKENIEKFPKQKEYILEAANYFEKAYENKLNVKDFIKIFKIYKTEKITRKIKMIILYNFPKLGNLLYNSKRKGV